MARLTNEDLEILNHLKETGSLGIEGHYLFYDYVRERFVYKNDNGNRQIFKTKAAAEMKISEFMPHIRPADALLYAKRIKLVFNPHEDRSIYVEKGETYINEFDVGETQLGLMREYRNNLPDAISSDLAWLKKYPYMYLLLSNIFEYNDDYIEYFINWLATAALSREKTRTVIACVGIQRAGKGILFEQVVFPYIFGDIYCVVAGDDCLEGQFNAELENKLFVSFNEVSGNFTTKSSIAGRLKKYISDKPLKINQKFGGQYIVDNHFNVSMSTNIHDAFKLENTDDRMNVFQQKKTLREAVKDTFNIELAEYIKLLKSELYLFVYNLSFYDYDVDRAGKTIMTPKKLTMIKLTSGSLENLCHNLSTGDYKAIEEDIFEIIEAFDNTEAKNKYSDNYYNYIKAQKSYLKDLENEMSRGLVSNKSLKFLHTLLIEDSNMNDKKIYLRFEKHLGKTKVSNSVRYRILEKAYLDNAEVEF